MRWRPLHRLTYLLRIARVPALVALLLAVPPLQSAWQQAFRRVELDGMQWTWALLFEIAVAFLVVAVVGSLADPRASAPMQHTGFGLATNWFSLALVLAWLVVVAESIVHRLRRRRSATPEPHAQSDARS